MEPIFNKPHNTTIPPIQQSSMDRMLKNITKAISGYQENCPPLTKERIQNLRNVEPLNFIPNMSAEKGKRFCMEDTHFYIDHLNYVLTGVFDGHRGDSVALFAAEKTQKYFIDLLSESNGDVLQAFEALFTKIQNELPAICPVGSTAVICYINKKTNLVYTATLGDSKASLYRKGQCIPLSCIRNWNSPKDKKHVISSKDQTETLFNGRLWISPKEQKPASMQSPIQKPARLSRGSSKGFSIDVSRALGDKDIKSISQKPKVTIYPLLPEDLLILASDGLEKGMSEEKMINILNGCKNTQKGEISKTLVTAALESSSDNVTVVAIELHRAS